MIVNIEAFLIAITILTLTPGLDTALIIRNSSKGGFKDGSMTSLGICLGLFVHATCSAIGISALLAQSAELFNVMKMIGASYLIYLGLMSLKGVLSTGEVNLLISNRQLPMNTPLRSLREGFFSNVLNPKTAIFYLAFLPQFIDHQGSVFLQSIVMASIHFVIAMIWQCTLAAALTKAKALLSSARFIHWMEATTGIVLIALGVKLLLEER